MMENMSYVAYGFGGLLVTLYSLSAFNDPAYSFGGDDDDYSYGVMAKPGLPKYMTEKSRYWFFCSLFIFLALIQYYLLAKLLPLIPGTDFFVKTDGSNKELIEAGMAFLAAPILIGVVNYIEWPRRLLFDYVKTGLHNFANIPEMGRSVFENLCYEPIDYDSAEAKEHIRRLLGKNHLEKGQPRQDIDESDFKVGNSKSITWKWARLSYGINVIEGWRQNPVFNSQLKESSLGWPKLRKAYIDKIDDLIEHREGRLTEDQKVQLNDEIGRLLANCHRLMACLVIMVAKPTEGPLTYIKKEGYQVIPGNRFLVNSGEVFRVIFTIVATIVVIALASLSVSHKFGIYWPEAVNNVLHCIFSGLIILAVPIVIVLFAKRQLSLKGTWPAVSRDNNPYHSFFEMPLILCTCLSVLSAIIATILIMIFNHLHNFQDIGVWRSTAVFCFISAITAFFTAYRTDIPPTIFRNRLSYYFKRSKGALLQGGLTALTVWAGLTMFHQGLATKYAITYTVMGFAVAVAINLALFTGKHHFERRLTPRSYEPVPVTAVLDGVQVQATLANQSKGGASLKVSKKHLLREGSKIELIMENNGRLFGRVVGLGADQMHISYAME